MHKSFFARWILPIGLMIIGMVNIAANPNLLRADAQPQDGQPWEGGCDIDTAPCCSDNNPCCVNNTWTCDCE